MANREELAELGDEAAAIAAQLHEKFSTQKHVADSGELPMLLHLEAHEHNFEIIEMVSVMTGAPEPSWNELVCYTCGTKWKFESNPAEFMWEYYERTGQHQQWLIDNCIRSHAQSCEVNWLFKQEQFQTVNDQCASFVCERCGYEFDVTLEQGQQLRNILL